MVIDLINLIRVIIIPIRMILSRILLQPKEEIKVKGDN